MPRRAPRRSVALALAALLLVAGAACGDDDDLETSTGADEAPLGDGGAAAGTCLEGTPDCQDTPMDPDRSDDAFPSDAARDEARSLLGEPESALGDEVRVSRRGEETFFLTEDYVLGRMTVEIDDDGSGTFVVTSVRVELPDGPETFEA